MTRTQDNLALLTNNTAKLQQVLRTMQVPVHCIVGDVTKHPHYVFILTQQEDPRLDVTLSPRAVSLESAALETARVAANYRATHPKEEESELMDTYQRLADACKAAHQLYENQNEDAIKAMQKVWRREAHGNLSRECHDLLSGYLRKGMPYDEAVSIVQACLNQIVLEQQKGGKMP